MLSVMTKALEPATKQTKNTVLECDVVEELEDVVYFIILGEETKRECHKDRFDSMYVMNEQGVTVQKIYGNQSVHFDKEVV